MKRAVLLATALLLAVLTLAQVASARTAESDGETCDENTNPLAVVLCDGSGDVALALRGSALYLGIEEGEFAVRLDSGPVRRLRQRVPCLDDPAAEVREFADGEYRVCQAPVFTRLRKGDWTIRLIGSGINTAFSGRGAIGLRGESGLISIMGAPYEAWPTVWTTFRFPPQFRSRDTRPTERT